jgi:hypothetical protein
MSLHNNEPTCHDSIRSGTDSARGSDLCARGAETVTRLGRVLGDLKGSTLRASESRRPLGSVNPVRETLLHELAVAGQGSASEAGAIGPGKGPSSAVRAPQRSRTLSASC